MVVKNSKWLILLGAWAAQTSLASTHIPLEHFKQVDLNGVMQVQIDVGQGAPSINIDRPAEQLSDIKLGVKNGVLKLEQASGNRRFAATKVIIHAPELNALRIRGNNQVNVHHLNTSHFNLWVDNHGDIDINGVVGLQQLTAQGSGFITIYWLNTPTLNLNSKGQIQMLLGGKVSNLHMNAAEKVSLNARHLVVTKAYIRAKDYARVDVSASQVLNAQAAGHSNIYYYQQPAFLGQHMYESGSVLNVVGEATVK